MSRLRCLAVAGLFAFGMFLPVKAPVEVGGVPVFGAEAACAQSSCVSWCDNHCTNGYYADLDAAEMLGISAGDAAAIASERYEECIAFCVWFVCVLH